MKAVSINWRKFIAHIGLVMVCVLMSGLAIFIIAAILIGVCCKWFWDNCITGTDLS